jgi:hypothetical protein
VIMVTRSRARKLAKRPLIELTAPVRLTSACSMITMSLNTFVGHTKDPRRGVFSHS